MWPQLSAGHSLSESAARCCLATLLVIAIIGVRPDLGLVMATPIFWAKIAFPLCLMIGALSMVMRLARLGIVSGPGKMLIVAAVASAWVGSIYVLLVAPPDDRVAIILGQTWKVCVLNITLLSIPGFIGVFLGATRSCTH